MEENLDSSQEQSIKAEESNLRGIFSGNFLFEIPIYQRAYAWQEEHVMQLLDDLISAAFEQDDQEPYFLGSLVIIKKNNTIISDVIDGQQRLTTLTILLSVLRNLIDNTQARKSLSKLIKQEEDILTRTTTEYRFKTKKADQNFFCNLIQEDGGLDSIIDINAEDLSESQQNIYKNTILINKVLSESKYTEDELIEFAQFIISKCMLIIVTAFSKEKAFRIFKVLNGRGMPLTMADMLKAELLEKIPPDQIEEYGHKWEETEEYLGQDEFEKLFNYIRTIKLNRKQQVSIFEDIKNNLKPHENPIDFIDNQLLTFGKSLSIIINENYYCKDNEIQDSINNELYWLKQLTFESWIPPTILFLTKKKDSPSEINAFLKQLNILSLGIGISCIYGNDRAAIFYKLIEEIQQKDKLSEISRIKFLSKEKKLIKSKISSKKFFNKNQRFTKLLLLKIEEKEKGINRKHKYNSISVEHVLPQNPKQNSNWEKDFNFKQRSELTNQIGNLVLLSIQKNRNAANKEFSEKKSDYLDKGNKPPFKITQDVLEEAEWKPEQIINRSKKLKDIAYDILNLN
ncbi:DUF262 domain-containing protein [Chondrinema litorale]|uniref:DUF262 domain-containing protein n=1 Tax=Chondrinema litorale TaxID=2994555 RepID=UPI0025437839|nr:DUF262 domain-containing HNH endonuclease family protein [Chondrinema litorale]UZR93137.1 DUF262 domain-containing HNH endonuclease family protein [Chondrinema litorale]